MKFNIKKFIDLIYERPYLVFLFFTLLIFGLYSTLFFSHFEADEWYHFSKYIPYTKEANGIFNVVFDSEHRIEALSDGQHANPLSDIIFFLSFFIFKMKFEYYAFMSLLVHSINTFVLYLFVFELVKKIKEKEEKVFISITATTFFALTAIPMQTVTWAAFYALNSLSVTFILSSLYFLASGINSKSSKHFLLSVFFLLFALLSKEISVVLFAIIPLIIFLNKKNINIKKNLKYFVIPFIFYVPYRLFLLVYTWVNSQNISSPLHVTSIDKSLLVFRAITFPINMVSEVFLPRQLLLSFLQTVTPILFPVLPNESLDRGLVRTHFIYGPANDLLIYIFSFLILILVCKLFFKYIKDKQQTEANLLLIGLFIILVSAMPLVLNAITLPWWGIDFFDSRHYYLPSIGASIIFSLFILELGKWLGKISEQLIHKSNYFFSMVILSLWVIGNLFVFFPILSTTVDTGYTRRGIIGQLQKEIKVLPKKAVYYIESDRTLLPNVQQPAIPFQTSFFLTLTDLYSDEELSQDYFVNYFINGTGEGYVSNRERAFGYFRNKKDLLDGITRKEYPVDEVYGFSYDFKTNKFVDISQSVKQDLKSAVVEREKYVDWKKYTSTASSVMFYYPNEAKVIENIGEQSGQTDIQILGSFPEINLKVVIADPAESLSQIQTKLMGFDLGIIEPKLKRLTFDKYNFNDSIMVDEGGIQTFIIKMGDKQISAKTLDDPVVESILGSMWVKK